MSHSAAYEQFQRSKSIGYDQWHDGVGYDMEAFAAMSLAERAAEAALAMAKSEPDWRDLDVIAAHDTRECVDHLRDLLLHDSVETRAHALGRLIDGGYTPGAVPDVQLAHILEALPDDDDHYPALTCALDLAQHHAGSWSKLVLLRRARDTRWLALHFVAALLDLAFDCPDTAAFDPRFRPTLLRLLPGQPEAERRAAFDELCREMSIDPATIPAEDDTGRLRWAEKTWPRA